jgi:hypothetical protein
MNQALYAHMNNKKIKINKKKKTIHHVMTSSLMLLGFTLSHDFIKSHGVIDLFFLDLCTSPSIMFIQ